MPAPLITLIFFACGLRLCVRRGVRVPGVALCSFPHPENIKNDIFRSPPPHTAKKIGTRLQQKTLTARQGLQSQRRTSRGLGGAQGTLRDQITAPLRYRQRKAILPALVFRLLSLGSESFQHTQLLQLLGQLRGPRLLGHRSCEGKPIPNHAPAGARLPLSRMRLVRHA